MKKILLIAVSFIALQSQAQNKVQTEKRASQFSIAAEGAVMATEQAFLVYQAGFGGSGKFLLPTGKKDFFTFTLGVLNWSAKPLTGLQMLTLANQGRPFSLGSTFDSTLSEINVANAPLRIITPKFGYKHFFNNSFSMEAEAGYCFATVKKLINSYPGEIGGYDFSIGFGAMVTKKLDIGLRYEQFQSTASQRDFTSFIALRTLVNIDFK